MSMPPRREPSNCWRRVCLTYRRVNSGAASRQSTTWSLPASPVCKRTTTMFPSLNWWIWPQQPCRPGVDLCRSQQSVFNPSAIDVQSLQLESTYRVVILSVGITGNETETVIPRTFGEQSRGSIRPYAGDDQLSGVGAAYPFFAAARFAKRPFARRLEQSAELSRFSA